MEDAHIANLDLGDGVSVFGVLDGHGGKFYSRYSLSGCLSNLLYFIGHEVAQYVEKHFVKQLKALESFKKKDYRTALQELFLKLDVLMLTKEGQKELQRLAAAPQNGSDGGGF